MIERRAVGDDADRRAQGVVQIGAFDRDHRVAPRQRQPCEIAEEIRQPRQLRAGLVDRAAVVERLQPVQRFQIGLERVGEPVDQPRAGADVHAAPGACLRTRRARFSSRGRYRLRSNSEFARSRRRWRDCGRRASRRCRPRSRGRRRNCRGFRPRAWPVWLGIFMSVSSFHDDGVALERRQHAFFGLRDMGLDDAGGARRRSRRCIASISATCSATSCVGSWSLTLATLTRTRRSACPIRSHSAAAMRRLPEACASAEWKARL